MFSVVPVAGREVVALRGNRSGILGLRALAALVLALSVSSCATFSERIAQVEGRLIAGDFQGAGSALEGVHFADRDQVLLLLNRGLIARYQRDFKRSNSDLEAAKVAMERLVALSLREVALASSVTEQAGAYAGRPFERLLAAAFKAMNYLDLDDRDGARVEALQIDLLLRELAGGRPEAEIPGAAFVRYLTGIVYELEGERSDAYIAYRQAAEDYFSLGAALPGILADDLARLARRLGRDDLPDGVPPVGERDLPKADAGEVILVVTAGLAPGLREAAAVVPEPVSGRLMRIALPELSPRRSSLATIRLRAEASGKVGYQIVDMFELAKKDLDSRLPGMTARLVARQVVKSQLVRQASKSAMKQSNDSAERVGAGLVALGAELTAFLTERADTRHWLSLPGSVFLARLPLAAGEHRLKVELATHYNETAVVREFPEFKLEPGERRWLSLHWAGG